MRTASVLCAALALASACDSAEPTTTAQPDEVAQADDDDQAADELERDHHGRRGDPTDRLCEQLGCNDQQRAEIDALFDPPDRERADDTAAKQALANAFRGDAFSTADLDAFMDAVRPGDRMAEHVEKLEALHGILSAEQRATLADEIAEHGFMGGRGRHDRKGEKKGKGEGGAAKFVAHKVDKLCEPLACTPEQTQKIAAIVSQAKAERPERDDDDAGRQAIADAMRAETFDTAAVSKQLEAAKAGHDERHAAKGDALVAIHDVLDANQRDQVADRIELEGPEAILGHGRHGKHGKHGPKI